MSKEDEPELPPLFRRGEAASLWFSDLRDRICAALEALEDAFADPAARPAALPPAPPSPSRFERREWQRPGGGGGVMSLMHGRVFEKAGVNVSTVWGEFTPDFRAQVPGAEESAGAFWASGISLVIHPRSPRIPTVHMNTRHIATSRAWFGGGADLTPMEASPPPGDIADFHAALKQACERADQDYYPRFKSWCDEYFFLPHRGEARGAGGIFFDHLDSGDFARDLAFTRDVGEAFLAIYPELVRRHLHEDWTVSEREHQLVRRGRYVEFNLLYDRGTQFGLRTGGNPEAILMSLPPEARWP